MVFKWLGVVGGVEMVVGDCLVNLDGLAEVEHFIISAFDYVNNVYGDSYKQFKRIIIY